LEIWCEKRTEFGDTHGSRHRTGRRSDRGPLPSRF